MQERCFDVNIFFLSMFFQNRSFFIQISFESKELNLKVLCNSIQLILQYMASKPSSNFVK